MLIRFQIIIGLAVIQGALLILMVFNSAELVRNAIEHELYSRSNIVSNLFASTVQPAVLGNDIALLESIVQQIAGNHDIAYTRIISSGMTLASYGDEQYGLVPFKEDIDLDSAQDDHVYDVATNILAAGQIIGRVEIGFSTADIDDAIALSRESTLIYVVTGGLATILFALVIGYFITKRLNELRFAATKIADGQFGSTTTVSGRDEITSLMRAFNDMSAKLKHLNDSRLAREKEITELNADLERRVADRTNSLNDLNKKLEFQALHDALTLLPNRSLFHDRLTSLIRSSKRSGKSFAVAVIDINDFKKINDSLGHNAGDFAIKHTAQACIRAIRESDTVARMGGDEFAVLLPNCDEMSNAVTVCQRILNNIAEPLLVDAHRIEITSSLGLAMFPNDGDNDTSLLNSCDIAMYEAKQKHLGIALYRPDLHAQRNDYLTLKTELRHAIDHGELVLDFQPTIELSSRAVCGVEALVRWRHPRLGLLYPDKFIFLAQAERLISSLTKVVIKLTLEQLSRWYDAGYEIPASVNVSTSDLQNPEFSSWVVDIVKNHRVPNRLLEFEITETEIMSNPAQAMESVRQLSENGFIVAIDDFGSGYSSMSYLQYLMISKVKIDRAFVTNIVKNHRDEVIVRSTVELAHNLGLAAVAEGVEDEEAWDKLKQLGCDSAQGYYMSKPIHAEKILPWAQENNWKLKTR